MKRLSFALLLSLSMALVACGDDGGDDGNNNPDVCEGKTLCAAEGTSCSGDTVVSCAADADGCLVETIAEDCAASGLLCDDASGSGECVAEACDDDPECVGASDGDLSCSGDELVSCSLGDDGCLDAEVTDCTAAGEICDDSEAPAVCRPDCDDHPLCVGAADGDLACDGFLLNSCADTNADGCLEFSQETCSPALCDDSGATPECGVVNETGLACNDAMLVPASGFNLSGTDFLTDFAGGIDLTDNATCGTTEVGAVSAVFDVALLAGETVEVFQSGGINTTIASQVGCDAAGACLDNDFDTLSHTAAQDETVTLIVQAEELSPASTDYQIDIFIDIECGNGLLEPGEFCDDGGTDDGDGCSATCEREFGFDCDGLSPSTCSPLPDLGTFGPGETVDPVVNMDSALAGTIERFTITFSQDVLLTGALTAGGTGDYDLRFQNIDGFVDLREEQAGDEAFTNVKLFGETYEVEVVLFALDADSDLGYSLNMDTGEDAVTLADGGTGAKTGTGLASGDDAFHVFTFSEDVFIDGTLTGDNGSDFDLLILGEEFFDFSFVGNTNVLSGAFDDLNEDFGIVLPQGTYYFNVNAFTAAVEDNYSLDFSVATLADGVNITDQGMFAAGGAIADITGGPLAEREFDHHSITFSDDVLISGTLSGTGAGEAELIIYDVGRRYVRLFGEGSFTDEELEAGTYIIQIRTTSAALGGGAVDTYTLGLTTTAVPAP